MDKNIDNKQGLDLTCYQSIAGAGFEPATFGL